MAEPKKTSKAPRKAAPRTTAKISAPKATLPAQDHVRRLIAEAAYYRAQQRGFTPGHELEDWVQAESEVMRRNGPR